MFQMIAALIGACVAGIAAIFSLFLFLAGMILGPVWAVNKVMTSAGGGVFYKELDVFIIEDKKTVYLSYDDIDDLNKAVSYLEDRGYYAFGKIIILRTTYHQHMKRK